jgi:hypothetical protein
MVVSSPIILILTSTASRLRKKMHMDLEVFIERVQVLRDIMAESRIGFRPVPVRDGLSVAFGQLHSKTSNKTLLCYDHHSVKPIDPSIRIGVRPILDRNQKQRSACSWGRLTVRRP